MKRLMLWILLCCACLGTTSGAFAQELPSLSVGDATSVEGNGRYREIVVPVSLSGVSSADVSARFRTRDLSATAPGDYGARSDGQVVIKVGQTRGKIVLHITGDVVEEADEQFAVELFSPKRATLADAEAIATIRDDDYAGQISVGDVSVPEGQSGATLVAVPVTFSTPPLHPIAVRLETKDDSAKASLGDYTRTVKTLTAPPGTSVLNFEVPIIGDETVERDERFFVRLSAPGYAANITRSLAAVRILNDDAPAPPPVAVSIGDVTVSEGDSGQTSADFTVTLEAPAPRDLDISYQTQDGTALSSSDYGSTSGVLRVPAGAKAASFSVPIVGDTVEEADEIFTVQLSASGGLNGDTQASALVKDNDYAGFVDVYGNTGSLDNDFRLAEGNSGTSNALFRLILTKPPLHAVELTVQLQDGTAVAGSDYVAQNQTLVFLPGETSRTLEVPVVGDTLVESDENFSINFLIAGRRAAAYPSRVLIINDDSAPPTGASIIAYDASADSVSSNREIYVINPDGTHRTRLTFRDERDVTPGLSRDGKRIVWVSSSLVFSGEHFVEQSEIWVMNADGSDQKRLFKPELGVALGYPRFSPDGGQIAFMLGGSSSSDPASVEIIGADGSGAHLVTDQAVLAPLSFSPDGSKIVFTSFTPPNLFRRIATVNLDGSERTRITSGEADAVDPSFSPDGNQIVFSMFNYDTRHYQLYLMNPDGSGVTPIASTELGAQPCFSPDGKQIAFGFGDGISIINMDGSGLRRLLNDGFHPTWSVNPTANSRSGASAKPSGGAS